LAKPHDENGPDRGYAEVFELVIGGMEIAPGYTELNDPDVQLENFKKSGQQPDEDFIEALKVGMPPAGGMGLGIDRLVAILTNQPSIRDVIPFPVLRPH
jgi:lysyl-tRNA synthetase class 2